MMRRDRLLLFGLAPLTLTLAALDIHPVSRCY